jgi:hypothetical protein
MGTISWRPPPLSGGISDEGLGVFLQVLFELWAAQDWVAFLFVMRFGNCSLLIVDCSLKGVIRRVRNEQ